MNTSLTEKQLTDIKKSLENSLVLVNRGLRHYSGSSVTPVTDSIIHSLDDPDSIYFKYPQFLFHFQYFDISCELVFKDHLYSVSVFNRIPSFKVDFKKPLHYSCGSFSCNYFNSIDVRSAPVEFLDLVKNHSIYGSCDSFESGVNLFYKTVYDFLDVEALPF